LSNVADLALQQKNAEVLIRAHRELDLITEK